MAFGCKDCICLSKGIIKTSWQHSPAAPWRDATSVACLIKSTGEWAWGIMLNSGSLGVLFCCDRRRKWRWHWDLLLQLSRARGRRCCPLCKSSFFYLVPNNFHPPSCIDYEFSQGPWICSKILLQKTTHCLLQQTWNSSSCLLCGHQQQLFLLSQAVLFWGCFSCFSLGIR